MSSLEARFRSTIIVLIVAVHIGLCMWGAYVHSPTIDEPAYLASGISHWQFGRFDLCKVSPPLVRLVAAIPVMLARPHYDWNAYRIGPGVRAEHTVGRDFLTANGERSFWLFTLGRWGCVPFSLIGAWISYRWARELFGQESAYAALLLWCFSPNILAHAQLLTPDIGVTALCLAACYTFWRWARSSTWMGAIGWGVALGLAVLAKTNGVVLFAALIFGFAVDALLSRRKADGRLMLQMVAGFLTSIYIINLGYGFQGTCRSLGEYEFLSRTFAGAEGSNRLKGTVLHSIPVPLPASFLEGIDLQQRDFENEQGQFKTYFRGKWYDHGWWWYYFYVVGVKVPEGTWVLFLVGGATVLLAQSNERVAVISYLVVPGCVLFALPCSQTGFGHSLRYVLPALPFALLIASAATSGGLLRRLLAGASLLWMLCSSLSCYPHSLSYFNNLAGGSENGHKHLLDGNLDWGQDLLYIKHWIESHPEARPVYVAYWGSLPVADLGVVLVSPTRNQKGEFPAGFYLVSVNHLHGDRRHYRPELLGFSSLPVFERVTFAFNAYHLAKDTILPNGEAVVTAPGTRAIE